MIAAPGLNVPTCEPIGRPLLDQLKLFGYTIIRIDLQGHDLKGLDLDTSRALAQEVIDAGLQPLCIVRHAQQITVLPEGALAEVGNEPDLKQFGWTVKSYRAEADRCVQVAIDLKKKLYVGAVSNLIGHEKNRGLKFLEQLPWASYPPEIGASTHRYPEGTSSVPHKGFATREAETDRFKQIVGARSLALTETGCRDGQHGLSEEHVAVFVAHEREFFGEQGFEMVCLYEINDGPDPHDDLHHYGIRRLDGSWKQSATAFTA